MRDTHRRVLEEIQRARRAGFPRPTCRSLADVAGLSGPSSAEYVLRALKRSGHLPIPSRRPYGALREQAEALLTTARDDGHHAICDHLERWLSGDM